MLTKKISVAIISSGVNIKNMLPHFLESADVIEIEYDDDTQNHPKTDVIICSLELTHSDNIDVAKRKIKKYLDNHSVVIFCEPSSLSFKELSTLGYRSIHTLFKENKLFGEINFDFFSSIGVENNITSVSDYGYHASYHVKSTNLIPIELGPEYDLYNFSDRPDFPLNFPVFDMEFFVLSRFGAPFVNLSSDLELIQFKALQPNASAGSMLLQNFRNANDIGETIYQTNDNSIKSMLNYIKEPIVAGSNSSKEGEWRELISLSYEKVNIIKLKNSIITGCGFLYSENSPIAKSDYLLPFLTPSIYQPIWNGLQHLHPLRSLEGPTIVAFNHLYKNYYHFLAECLQSAHLIYETLKNSGKKSINIVTCKLNGFSKEYFEILFAKNSDVSLIELSESEYIFAEELYYSPEILGYTTPQPCLIAERRKLRNSILLNSGVDFLNTSQDMIYISRKDTNARQICNENELINALENLGVKTIQLTGRSVKEQIEIFSNASLVIGGHGAGISNSLFMSETSVMLELIQASYLNVGPMRLAQSSGAQYVSMLFSQDGEGNSWYVDIERVCHFIEQYIAHKLQTRS